MFTANCMDEYWSSGNCKDYTVEIYQTILPFYKTRLDQSYGATFGANSEKRFIVSSDNIRFLSHNGSTVRSCSVHTLLKIHTQWWFSDLFYRWPLLLNGSSLNITHILILQSSFFTLRFCYFVSTISIYDWDSVYFGLHTRAWWFHVSWQTLILVAAANTAAALTSLYRFTNLAWNG